MRITIFSTSLPIIQMMARVLQSYQQSPLSNFYAIMCTRKRHSRADNLHGACLSFLWEIFQSPFCADILKVLWTMLVYR